MKAGYDLLRNYDNDDRFGVYDHMHRVAKRSTDFFEAAVNTDWEESVYEFEHMGLNDNILRGIYAYGFVKPSAIQRRAIRPISFGFDLIAQADSGTGKTATYVIGMLTQISPDKKWCQGLIVVPTRELGHQVQLVASAISQFSNIKIGGLFGGASFSQNVNDLNNGLQLAIGTPGRIIALIEKNALRLETLRIVALDEVDTLLAPTFIESTKELLNYIPKRVQTVVFSATVTNALVEVTKNFMKNPFTVQIRNDDKKNISSVRQFYLNVNDEDEKFHSLFDIYSCLNITKAVIFVNTRHKVEVLAAEMEAMDFTVSTIHGDMTQKERNQVMTKFRTGDSRVLISSDLTARGIDVVSVSMVINYQMPIDRESYIHRIGRTGRFGRKGVVVNLVLPSEEFILRDLEHSLNILVEEMPPYYHVLTNLL